MKVKEGCAECLWNRQRRLSDDPAYLADIRAIIDHRREKDCAPYLVYLFNQVYEKHFGKRYSYREIKKTYNDLLLSKETVFRQHIEQSDHPLKTALVYARIGNYIDFGAIREVDENTFFSLFEEATLSEQDQTVFASFLKQCQTGKRFLLAADNCGEIVLDKLFLEQLHKDFPHLELTVMVRGGEVLNDVTVEDAAYVGIDQIADIVSGGKAISGTVYEELSEEAKQAVDQADIIFAKGQGNYESMAGQGRHIFYSFLCKCDLFVNTFHVPKFTGLFLEETGN